MRPPFWIISFGIIILFFSCQSKSKIPQNEKAKEREQRMFEYPSSIDIKFEIEAKKEYQFQKPIEIILIWENKSTKDEKISLKEEFKHPIGIHAIILNEERESVVKHSSSHIYSSKLFTKEFYKEGEVIMQPNQIINHKVDLLQIPVFKNPNEGFSRSQIPKGKYFVQISNRYHLSKEVEIEIK